MSQINGGCVALEDGRKLVRANHIGTILTIPLHKDMGDFQPLKAAGVDTAARACAIRRTNDIGSRCVRNGCGARPHCMHLHRIFHQRM